MAGTEAVEAHREVTMGDGAGIEGVVAEGVEGEGGEAGVREVVFEGCRGSGFDRAKNLSWRIWLGRGWEGRSLLDWWLRNTPGTWWLR